MGRQLTKLSKTIWSERYAHPGETCWSDTARRIANFIAQAEQNGNKEKYSEEFYNLIDNMDMLPGGRIMANSGRPKASLINCFILDINDSREGIGETLKNYLILSGCGGGVGISFKKVRFAGAPIVTAGGFSSGSVSFMNVINSIADTIKSGGGRRAATMLSLPVDHPDLMEFISAKLNHKNLTNANVSVEINSTFINFVKRNKNWNLMWAGQKIKTLKAREIWDILIKNALKSGEPGILNMELANKMSNSYYFNTLLTSNPCLVGDTLVAVADGRKHISIKELADQGKDVPVYCLDRKKDKVVIRTMRNPRLTGVKQKILKVTLDDGSFIRCTENHKFILTNGQQKQAKDLSIFDSLARMDRIERTYDEIISKKRVKPNKCDYFCLEYRNKKQFEHRLIAEHHFNADISPGFVVHHMDNNPKNNDPSNLKVMKTINHCNLHAKERIGDNNPMRRAQKEWSKAKWEKYHKNMSNAVSAEKNGRYCGITNDELKVHAIKLTNKLQHRFSQAEWLLYAKENNLPQAFSNWRKNHFNGVLGLAKLAALECGIENIDCDPRVAKTYKKILHEGYDCIAEDGAVFILKQCESCSNQLKIHYSRRETGICSSCNNKRLAAVAYKGLEKSRQTFIDQKKEKRQKQILVYTKLKAKLGRKILKTEWEKECLIGALPHRLGKYSPFNSFKDLQNAADSYNHRVTSIDYDGYEDVYNGTVDEFHNFFVGGNTKSEKFNRNISSYVCNLQCGEIMLPGPSGVCCLASINVNNFLTADGIDEKRFKSTVKTSIRFLDNVLSVNTFPLQENIETSALERRIGLGLMGVHTAMIQLGIKYSSRQGIEFIEYIYELLRDASYIASSNLAAERGPFPAFKTEEYLNSGFCKTLPAAIRRKVSKNGMRNVCVTDQPPTGTSALLPNVSSGIEPIFAPIFKRTFFSDKAKDDIRKSEIVIDKSVQDYIDAHPNYKIEDLSHIEGAGDICPRKHFEAQEAAQRSIDNAVSKTLNLPKDFKQEDLSEIMLEFAGALKGTTIYREGSREFEPLQKLQLNKTNIAKATINEEKNTNECPSGVCDI